MNEEIISPEEQQSLPLYGSREEIPEGYKPRSYSATTAFAAALCAPMPAFAARMGL